MRSLSSLPVFQRDPPKPQDLALSPIADRWLSTLPDTCRPEQLPRRYPRIVNRIALCWPDRELAEQVFEALIVDRRGARCGFPPGIREELDSLRRRLRDVVPRREKAHVARTWDLLSPNDR